MVGVGTCKCFGCLSVHEDEREEEEVGHPGLQGRGVGSVEHVVLEPGDVCADNHDHERDADTVVGGTVLEDSGMLEDGYTAGLAEPDVPELAHD